MGETIERKYAVAAVTVGLALLAYYYTIAIMNTHDQTFAMEPANDNVSPEEIAAGKRECGTCERGGFHYPYTTWLGPFPYIKCIKCEQPIADLPIGH